MKKYMISLSLILSMLLGTGVLVAQTKSDSTAQDLIQLPFGTVTKDRLVGAVDELKHDDLMHTSYPSVYDAIQAQVPGYVLGRIRGYARQGNDEPLVIIDGLANRSLSSLSVDEIESIEFLKDVTAKMLYGSRAANGVIVVTTRRGYESPKKFTVTTQYGLRNANDYPEFLGAAEYMKFRNMALKNDGKDPLYTDEDIAMAGTSYKYPDVDYYDMFVKDHTSYQKVNLDLIGGDAKTKYYLNMGYMGEGGLEKVGDERRTDVMKVRSNLDYEVNKVISVNLDIAGRFYMTKGNHVSTNKLFTELSTRKPNDYPIFISSTPNVDSLGTSDVVGGKNLYGDMVYSGYKREITSFAQTNLGMNFDFNDYVQGLTGKAYATFDINNYIAEGKKLTYRTLKPAIGPNGQDTLLVNGVYNPKGNEQRLGDNYYRNLGGGAYLSYDRTFGDHAVNAVASYLINYKTIKTKASDMNTVQDDKGMNFGIRANYAYKDKYVAEYSGVYMGSNRFHKDNRWKLFNAVGLGYVLSKEDFMQDVNFVDYLKLKASYGKIGYDQSFDHLLYNDYYKYWAGSYKTGVKNAETLVGTEYIQAGNKRLTFEESKEMNIGLDATLFNNHLDLSAEYYTEERSGMPTKMKYAFPQITGAPDIVDNYNSIKTTGWELTARYSGNAGDLKYSLGGWITHYSSEWTKYDELNDFSFQNIQGTKTDAIWGYIADGFYTSAEDIATYGAENGVPLTSSLGTVIPGDLKFKNISNTYDEYTYNDNVINKYDRTIIGNSRPRYVYGLNLQLKYKGLSLYALGEGRFGYDRMKTWPTYYTNKGNVKYSPFAYEAAVPAFDENGVAVGLESNDYTLPRLTTEGAAHSYNASTFFLQKAYFFRVRTVELKYDLPKRVSKVIASQQANIFVRGDNLLTIADEDTLDPISPNSGLTTAPVFKTYTVGLQVTF